MDQKLPLYDIIGNEIKPGDAIVQYRGYHSVPAHGTVLEILAGKDGRPRVRADGDFKQAFLPKNLLNVSALGIRTKRRQRPMVWPELLREFNGQHVKDAFGYEARANDKVLFWHTTQQLAVGTIRSFSGNKLTITLPPLHEDEVVRYVGVEDRNFIIYTGELPIPEEKLYREKKRLPRPRPVSKKPRRRDNVSAIMAFCDQFSVVHADWAGGKISEEEYRTAVQDLMKKYGVMHVLAGGGIEHTNTESYLTMAN